MTSLKKLPIVLYKYDGESDIRFTTTDRRQHENGTRKKLLGSLVTSTYPGFLRAYRDGDSWAIDEAQKLLIEFKKTFKFNQAIVENFQDSSQKMNLKHYTTKTLNFLLEMFFSKEKK